MRQVVVKPYGARIYDSLYDLVTELELADSLTKELKALGGSSLRRQSRKPKTPTKISKTAQPFSSASSKKTKGTQTEE